MITLIQMEGKDIESLSMAFKTSVEVIKANTPNTMTNEEYQDINKKILSTGLRLLDLINIKNIKNEFA